MRRRIVDLTAEELDRLASEAWSEAASVALQAGAPIVGREGDKIIKTYPDGHTEILGENQPLEESVARTLHSDDLGVSLHRLYHAILATRNADPSHSRTARLLRSGRGKIAKKLMEEAVELVIDAMHHNRDSVVRESADLFYNLVVLWVASNIHPEDISKEMRRRERLLGIAENLPARSPAADQRRKIVALFEERPKSNTKRR